MTQVRGSRFVLGTGVAAFKPVVTLRLIDSMVALSGQKLLLDTANSWGSQKGRETLSPLC